MADDLAPRPLPHAEFLSGLPTFASFESVADAARYQSLPDHWMLAATDIVGSTDAIAEGRYKDVNMAGASMISALLNALDRRDLPFVFGGDGALLAVPGEAADLARETLAAVQAWVADTLDLKLRAALVPMSAVRAQGLDVRVARFQASDQVTFAMFSGGGASWAEAQMKAGAFAVPAAPSGTRPNLSGLSCRWNPIAASRGEIVSIIAMPVSGGSGPAFQALVDDIVRMIGAQDREGHPIAALGVEVGFSRRGVEREAQAMAPKGGLLKPKLAIWSQIVLTWALLKLGLNFGPFDPRLYTRDVADNSDFRKFDDGLKMTVDLDEAMIARVETRLAQAEAAGICRFGIHRQSSALMTCLVTTPLQRDHVHFIDGATGGYAVAAANMKAKAAA